MEKFYCSQIKAGNMTLAEVPTLWKEKVRQLIETDTKAEKKKKSRKTAKNK